MTEQKVKVSAKPRVGIYGFTGCAGDQLLIIHSEDHLLDLFKAVDIRSFVMASSRPIEEEIDVALVEGSISTEEEKAHIKEIRNRAKVLIAIGNCAVSGGPQAMFAADGEFAKRLKQVYGETKFITDPIEATPIDAHVTVDYYLPGCPISAPQTFALLSRLIHGASPDDYMHPVCHECKMNENRCFLVDKKFCLGSITAGGCGSACINVGLPCVGCWGPNRDGNFASVVKELASYGIPKDDIMRRIRNYGGHKILQYIKDLK
jgi:sulfhydrogenase subunit delta